MTVSMAMMRGLIIPRAGFLGWGSRTVAGLGGSAWRGVGCLRLSLRLGLVSGFGAGLRVISREERVLGASGFKIGDKVPKRGGLVEVTDGRHG